MTEYIDRDAALEEMEWACVGQAAFDAVNAVPAADVRPVVRGKWKLGGYGQISDATVKWYDQFLQGGFLYCSVCKSQTSTKFNFCPNCGADMRIKL